MKKKKRPSRNGTKRSRKNEIEAVTQSSDILRTTPRCVLESFKETFIKSGNAWPRYRAPDCGMQVPNSPPRSHSIVGAIFFIVPAHRNKLLLEGCYQTLFIPVNIGKREGLRCRMLRWRLCVYHFRGTQLV